MTRVVTVSRTKFGEVVVPASGADPHRLHPPEDVATPVRAGQPHVLADRERPDVDDLGGYVMATLAGYATVYRPEDMYIGTRLAALTAIDSGITSSTPFNASSLLRTDSGIVPGDWLAGSLSLGGGLCCEAQPRTTTNRSIDSAPIALNWAPTFSEEVFVSASCQDVSPFTMPLGIDSS